MAVKEVSLCRKLEKNARNQVSTSVQTVVVQIQYLCLKEKLFRPVVDVGNQLIGF